MKIGALILMMCSIIPWASAQAPKTPMAFAESDQVDKAVERGLAYLSKVQTANGSFPEDYGRTTGGVSLGGMAFLAKGYLPGRQPYGEVINRCIDYIIASQLDNGMLAKPDQRMYSHAISTLFLCEVSGMVDALRQKKLDAVLPKAVKLILAAQQVHKADDQKGGWRYTPTDNSSDMSCTGWALMALRSARLNGSPVPDKAIEAAVKYILNHCDPAQGTFGYQDKQSNALKLTGAGLLCLELTGHHGEPATLKSGDYILNNYEKLPGQEYASYGNYYNAQGMFQLGGKYWARYSTWMYGFWLPLQKEDGSWPQKNIGVCYETAMVVLALTVPYRQLPIYQRDETVDEQ
ncbi:MAG: prenyltransferase/squalene oxidase repeat-containing protein [bacterium]